MYSPPISCLEALLEVQKWIQFPISLHFKSAQETKDEYYEMLQKISTHLVGYCFKDEIATVIS